MISCSTWGYTDGFLIHGRRARFQILNGEIKPCIYNPMYFACRPFVHASPHAKPYQIKIKVIKNPMYLGSFKLSYVGPENHKIGKMGWWKLGRKRGVWRRKTGFENFSLNENWCFEVDLQFGEVEKMIYWRKRPKMAEKIFWKNLGRSRKSIQFGKLDQKSLFFIWFFYR